MQNTAQKNTLVFLTLVGALLLPLGLISAQAEDEPTVIEGVEVVESEDGSLQFNIKPRYYPLVDAKIRPDLDEFYVSSIYSIGEHPKALIKQSTNTRTGALFSSALEYGVGDKLGDDHVIVDIRTGERKDVIVENIKTQNKYFLRVNYGAAKSRLVPLGHTPYKLKTETKAPSKKEQLLKDLKEAEKIDEAPAKKSPKLKAQID